MTDPTAFHNSGKLAQYRPIIAVNAWTLNERPFNLELGQSAADSKENEMALMQWEEKRLCVNSAKSCGDARESAPPSRSKSENGGQNWMSPTI
jgi:hypothetical protein